MLDPALTSSTRCLSSSVTSMMCATMPAEMTGLTGSQHDDDNDDDNDDNDDDNDDRSYWLSTNDPIPMMPVSERAIPGFISRYDAMYLKNLFI